MKTYLYWIIGILALIALLRSTQVVLASFEAKEDLTNCQQNFNQVIEKVGIENVLH